MNIDDQIKQLMRLKSKIELYNDFTEFLNNQKNSERYSGIRANHTDLLDETVDEAVAFLKQRVQELSNVAPPQAPKVVRETDLVVEKPAEKRKTQPHQVDESGEPTDPIKFLLKYRHLDGKKVFIKTGDGEEVGGVIRGMVTPFLKVETATGYNINVKPADVRVQE